MVSNEEKLETLFTTKRLLHPTAMVMLERQSAASFQLLRMPWSLLMVITTVCAMSAFQTMKFVSSFSNKDIITFPFANSRVERQTSIKIDDENATDVSVTAIATEGDCLVSNLSIALSCLHQTKPDLKLTYPDDAKEHFLEIHRALERWIGNSRPHCHSRFCGPWIENHWIINFQNLTTETSCLSESFGPFVPLFIPWVDLWVNRPKKFKYPKGFIDELMKVLRPDVPYITVSQNDQGLPASKEMPLMHNILVLSAGGYGHVPIPLLKQEERAVEPLPFPRQYLVSYVGHQGHAPDKMRVRMNDYFNETLDATSYTHYYAKTNLWRNIMANSQASLTPRGYGRTSYHVMETLQMGLIPIHVYLDVPWVPYLKLFETLGFIATVEELPALVQMLNYTMQADDFRDRERRIVSCRDSHFSVPGIMTQIKLFLKGTGDLECAPLPKLVRGDPIALE